MPFLVRKRVRRGANRDWMPGDVITGREARAASRFRLLVREGWLRRTKEAPVPPLEDGTVADVRRALPRVTSVQAIRRAMQNDTRKTTQTLYKERLAELEGP